MKVIRSSPEAERFEAWSLARPAARGTAISSRVGKVASPMLGKLGPPPQFRTVIPSANYFHALSDTSTGLRSLSAVASGTPEADLPTMGLTTMLYMGIGGAWVKDSAKQYRIAGKLEDTVGQRLALGNGLRAAGLTIGATATLPLRCISFADMVGKIQDPSFVPSDGVKAATGVLGHIANFFFGIYYAWTAGRAGYNIYKRNELKDELEKAIDPMDVIDKRLRIEQQELEGATDNELMELAVDAGADWLEKVQKEWQKAGLGDGKISSERERKQIFYRMVGENPGILDEALGIKARGLGVRELLVEFGREVKQQRLMTKKEQELGRIVGDEVMAKIKSGELRNMANAKEYLIGELDRAITRDWGVLAIGVIGFTVSLLGWVFTGGTLNILTAIGFIITSVLWIACGDGEALMRHWSQGGVGKYDKFMIYFSCILCGLAVLGTLALSIMSGGVFPIILLAVVGVSWMVINGRALYRLKKFEQAPWEFESTVKPRSFHLLTQTGATENRVRAYFEKMEQNDRLAIEEIFVRVRREMRHVGQLSDQQWLACMQEASRRYYEMADAERLASLEGCRQIFNTTRDRIARRVA